MNKALELAETNSWNISFDFSNAEPTVSIETQSHDYTLPYDEAKILEFMEALELVESFS